MIRVFGTALILVATALPGLFGRPDRFARRQIVDALWRATVLPLPLVGALAGLLGATVALAIGTGFAILRIEELVLPVLRDVLMRYAVPLLIGLLSVGQGGLALTTRLASMETSGEADTLRSLGIAPAHWVLPPSLLEMLVFGAVQFVCAAAIAQLAAALVFQIKFGVPSSHYADFLAGPAARSDFWNGAARSEASALLVWLAAAVTGVSVRSGPDQLARATRTTFVAGLLGILLLAYLFTVASR